MKNLRALHLVTRQRENAYEAEACLLVYGLDAFSDEVVSSDIRVVLDERPATQFVYIAAPEMKEAGMIEVLAAGESTTRKIAEDPPASVGRRFFILSLHVLDERISVRRRKIGADDFSLEDANAAEPLPVALQDGWLFDLFSSREGFVNAPDGVHFRKGSKKHSEVFLRAANVLLDKNCCLLLGFFALAHQFLRAPRNILVDTAPLISVAFCMARIAGLLDIWDGCAGVRSFSSYGGLAHVGRPSSSDLVLVSATTSGGLARELVRQGFLPTNVIQIFYLADSNVSERNRAVVCDLTYFPGRSFGFRPVRNFQSENCPLCKKGFVLAELEGDQFLLQQRGQEFYDIKKKLQSSAARALFECVCRSHVISAVVEPSERESFVCVFDGDAVLGNERIRAEYIRLLRRFCPAPLSMVVLCHISEDAARALLGEAGLAEVTASAALTSWERVGEQRLPEDSGVLVMFGCLQNHSVAREINTRLRVVAPRGNIAYLAGITVSECDARYADLKVFLQYGERGVDTFVFRSAKSVSLPLLQRGEAAWLRERELLMQMETEGSLPAELVDRKWLLLNSGEMREKIFLARPGVDLRIGNDFVYLTVDGDAGLIYQADVFAIVANLLAEARAQAVSVAGGGPVVDGLGAGSLSSSIYSQGMLAPQSFEYYSDAILRAALLRAANPRELMYRLDESASRELARIIDFEITEYGRGMGDSLPEFVMALATGQLQLCEADTRHLKMRLCTECTEGWLVALAQQIQV